MKITKCIGTLSILILLTACSSDDGSGNGQEIQSARSQICNNVVGPTAAYWDYSNALPIALTQVPLIQNPGPRFIHSQMPMIGFTIPQGYNANEVTDFQNGTLGVNVFRNDNAVVWRYIPVSRASGQIPINNILATEINQMLAFFNFNGTPEVVCTTTKNENTVNFISSFGARLLNFNGITGLVWAVSRYSPTLGTTYITLSISAAPTNEFDNMVMSTFLPISWQLLVGNDKGVVDNDNDGVPANVDPDDNDPNVP